MISLIRNLFAFFRPCPECEKNPEFLHPDGAGGVCKDCYARLVSQRLNWKGERHD